MTQKYAWDEAKRAKTLSERGIDFAVVEDFDWDSAQIRVDRRRDYGEARRIARGLIKNRLFILAFVLRGDVIRVISLRKANKREQRSYASLRHPSG